MGWFSKEFAESKEILPPNLQHPAGSAHNAFERLLALRSHMQAGRHAKLLAKGHDPAKTEGGRNFVEAALRAQSPGRDSCSADGYARIEQLAVLLSLAGRGLTKWWEQPLPDGRRDVSFIKHGQWGIWDKGYKGVKTGFIHDWLCRRRRDCHGCRCCH